MLCFHCDARVTLEQVDRRKERPLRPAGPPEPRPPTQESPITSAIPTSGLAPALEDVETTRIVAKEDHGIS